MRRSSALVAVVVAVCLAVPVAFGQEAQVKPEEGIPVGPFLFSPALELTWESRDNIFFTPDNPVDDTIWLARARLLFELPIYDSYLVFSYTPQYRDYADYDLRENWSHFFTAGGTFEFASGLKLDVGYRYVSGNLETREVDPGGEFVFGDRQFDKNEAHLRADYWTSPTNGFSLEAEYTDLSYDKPALFYDYTRTRFGIGWLHQISPTLVMDLKYVNESFDAEQTFQFRDSDTDSVLLELRGEINPVLHSSLEIGWRSTSFDTAPGDPPIDDFSGFVARGSLMWELAHGSEFVIDLLRWDYPSAYGLNAYYTATGGTLTYRLKRDRLFGHIRVGYQNNDYDVPDVNLGRTRSDDITSYSLGLGYRFTRQLSLRGTYTHQERDTLHPYSYDANTFLVGLVLGF